MKNFFKTIGIFALLFALMIVLFGINSVRYNDGICTECGNQLSFAGAAPSYRMSNRIFTHYFYTCENCGHTVETSFLMT